MIYLITGQPGHGKTNYAIDWALRLQKQGRVVVADGIKDFSYDAAGFERIRREQFYAYDPAELDDDGNVVAAWQHYPPGTVFLIDECYRYFPTRANGSKVPPAVDALARHRHGGFDFLLVTQKPNQIDSFLQGLVEQHEHLRSKFGIKGSMVKKWDRFESNSLKAGDQLSTRLYRWNRDVFKLYTSTEKDTSNRRVPWFIWVAIALIAVVFYGFHHAENMFGGKRPVAAAAPAADVAGRSAPAPSQEDADDTLRRRDYAKWITARMPGMPWTAPAWDSLKPQGVPDLYCVAVDDGRCMCNTEQGTHYDLDVKICRKIAAGGSYNPFRKPLDVGPAQGTQQEGKPPVADTAPPPQQLEPRDQGTAWTAGVGSQSYTPPAAPGSWNPDPFSKPKQSRPSTR